MARGLVLMSYRKSAISQAEIQRTWKAAISAGLSISSYEVDYATGRMTVTPVEGASQATGPDPDELLR